MDSTQASKALREVYPNALWITQEFSENSNFEQVVALLKGHDDNELLTNLAIAIRKIDPGEDVTSTIWLLGAVYARGYNRAKEENLHG